MAATRAVIKSEDEAHRMRQAGLLLYDSGNFVCRIDADEEAPSVLELVNGWLYYLVEDDDSGSS